MRHNSVAHLKAEGQREGNRICMPCPDGDFHVTPQNDVGHISLALGCCFLQKELGSHIVLIVLVTFPIKSSSLLSTGRFCSCSFCNSMNSGSHNLMKLDFSRLV